jgi:hypothetical protein
MSTARPTALPIPDRSGAPRALEEFDIPEELYPQSSTETYGELRTILLKLLKPLEEKHAASRAKGDAIQVPYELSRASIAGVINADGKEFEVRSHDGGLDSLWSQMHPAIRSLVMQGYADIAAPSENSQQVFLKSRRTRA